MTRVAIWSVLVVVSVLSFGAAVHYRNRACSALLRQELLEQELRKARSRVRSQPVDSKSENVYHVKPVETDYVDRDVAPDVGEYQSRIHDLENTLADRDALIFVLQQNMSNAVDRARSSRRSPREWLEELKQNDPQRYESFTNRWARVRQEAQISAAEKSNYFGDRDLSNMSQEEQAEYRHMTELLDETWNLTAQLQGDLSQEDRRAVMRNLHHNMRELGPLLEAQRSREWYNLGLQIGYKDNEAHEFANYLDSIIYLTSMDSFRGGSMRGGFGGRRRGTDDRGNGDR